jgi:hypothetical protein
MVHPHLPPLVLIGLAGSAGAGKSTAARHLREDHEFERLRFAGPLKAMIRALLEAQGVGLATAIRMTDGDLKEVPTKYLGGRTPRYAMQTLGTEWGRDLIAADFWLSAAREMIAKERLESLARHDSEARIVFDDVRFANEAEFIRALGGRVIRITRADAQPSVGAAHASEGQTFAADIKISNDGSIEDLTAAIDAVYLKKPPKNKSKIA